MACAYELYAQGGQATEKDLWQPLVWCLHLGGEKTSSITDGDEHGRWYEVILRDSTPNVLSHVCYASCASHAYTPEYKLQTV